MISVTLTSELEAALVAQASQRGTTPELLAIATLQAHFVNGHGPEVPEPGSLAELLGTSIGCLDSGQFVKNGARLSETTGRKFAAGMMKKRRDNKL
jgi:hypothetical protein